MPEHARTLYTWPFSHYCVSAERMLAFKGLPYEASRVVYHDRQALIAASGQDYIPTLVEDGTPILWHDLPDHLERLRPSPTLFPRGEAALARLIESWGHDVLEERIWQAVVTRVAEKLPDAQERWVFEELQSRARGPWHVLEARRPEFEEVARRELRRVDGLLADREWILGSLSVADFGVFGSLSPWLSVGNPLPDSVPHLAAWIRRIDQVAPPRTPSG